MQRTTKEGQRVAAVPKQILGRRSLVKGELEVGLGVAREEPLLVENRDLGGHVHREKESQTQRYGNQLHLGYHGASPPREAAL